MKNESANQPLEPMTRSGSRCCSKLNASGALLVMAQLIVSVRQSSSSMNVDRASYCDQLGTPPKKGQYIGLRVIFDILVVWIASAVG